MEPQQERGFWSQLTTVSKVLIFLIVLGVLGGSAWYIFNNGKEDSAAKVAAPLSDSIAADHTGNTVMTDSVAVDSKIPSQREKVETPAEEVPVKGRTAEAKAAAVKKLKANASAKKTTTPKSEPAPAKPKKKTKNNEDVEVDI
ncbi:hypothetical protein [Runella slithyformis]|uniref:Uncharacterized protein n=1 Tax=Runella slithyformis (strain ATCC 29530 / DSM 19594 / LMG 11500 / NCIMB 11436 / LSU 4) TaxID=761193 RepID=A0A7U3ZI11_RUNSL|nr:hypothetical protein [Runella slithyformis]AEI47580.1 hypothetical protein Runsl_1151 [Runella slithyformis DSM 19594]